MVFQRDKPINIWGTVNLVEKITVTTSWDSTSYETKAGSDNNWQITLPPVPVKRTPQTITVTAEGVKSVVLDNILIGDVWLCAGQSNMVMPLGNIPPFSGVENYVQEIGAADHPLIRFTVIPEASKGKPMNELARQPDWKVCSPQTASELSAVAYYFAQKLQRELNIPIGIVVAAVNGSWCESWTDLSSLQAEPALNTFTYYGRSASLYNAMIHPLKKLGLKGFTWYQGENNQNISPSGIYTILNSALIKGWRNTFAQGELPFYYTQLTPFDEDGSRNDTLNNLARFREAQAAIRNLPGTGMAVTMDAGDVDNHHPAKKKPVGERLALLALNNTYAISLTCLGPQFSSFEQRDNKIVVKFVKGTANGLSTADNTTLKQHFTISGPDYKFRYGEAKISGDEIIITVPQGMQLPILAVRYAFSNFPITNLQNSDGLPAEPFRSDNWPN